MQLEALQHLRMEQKLKLAPRMIQSMEILQLPLTALEERIAQELEKNPTLELAEAERLPDSELNPEAGDDPSQDRALVIDEEHNNQDDFQRLDNIDALIDPNNFDQRPPSARHNSGEEDPKMQALANTAARDVSLHEYLMLQWDLADGPEQVRLAGEAIINHIEPDGYLKTDFQTLAAKSDLPDDEDLWERALQKVQKLDPPGIGARSARECLLLQIDALGEEHNFEREIIERYFDLLQNKEFGKISKLTGSTIDEIKGVIEFIKTRLVLHPGIAFGSARIGFIVPDVIVDYDEDAEDYVVSVPDDGIPSVHISKHYVKMLQDPSVDDKTKKYIRNKLQSAQWIIDAVEQRRQTLRRVAERIIEAQREFLEKGPKFLKPLPMAEVADKVGVHLATVSRAVSEKFVQTPRGIYSLRSFFTGGTETESGESVSWDSVREKIKELIENEDKTDPLKDDKIVELLREEGVTLARRTVAKYRKILNIPSSHKRREK